MTHLDLFSGIGGFALAVDTVWPGSTHVFCDNDKFCQKILNKHWPESKIYGDIRTITEETKTDILTGGFPCQPFSSAGRKRGTADNRYLWPEMFRVIQLTKPTWIIAENVSGFIGWNEGLVLEQVCTDLESEDYEVQPFIIPACAVNAPHRRERAWIIAHAKRDGQSPSSGFSGVNEAIQQTSTRTDNTINLEGADSLQGQEWDTDWMEIAAKFCGVDDGVSNRVDRIKTLGNAIVPQVAIELMRCIK